MIAAEFRMAMLHIERKARERAYEARLEISAMATHARRSLGQRIRWARVKR